MRRWGVVGGALLAVQIALVAVYVGLGDEEIEAPFVWERLDLPAPASLEVGEGRVVVHFWATWCEPCRTELPDLIAAAEEEGVRLIAATDEARPVVERFFGGVVPAAIVADPGAAARREYAVSGLPDTFVVEEGRVVARVGGPRDWSSPSGRRFLRGTR